MLSEMHRICRTMKQPAIRMFLERPEPCEGKLSRTVFSGCGRVSRPRLPGAAFALLFQDIAVQKL
jgi:hypothetical protein